MKRLILITVSTAVLGFLLYACWHPRMETTFAAGFNQEAFLALPIGSTIDEAQATLGNPLGMTTQSQSEVWWYGLPNRFGTSPLTWWAESQNMAFANSIASSTRQPAIVFDEQGKVSDTPNWVPFSKVQTGDEKGEVIAALGQPSFIVSPDIYTYWNYSGPEHDDANYERWSLLFTSSGRLIGKHHELLYD